jgi:hypothetical protein
MAAAPPGLLDGEFRRITGRGAEVKKTARLTLGDIGDVG